jgi:hypothetical protein
VGEENDYVLILTFFYALGFEDIRKIGTEMLAPFENSPISDDISIV